MWLSVIFNPFALMALVQKCVEYSGNQADGEILKDFILHKMSHLVVFLQLSYKLF